MTRLLSILDRHAGWLAAAFALLAALGFAAALRDFSHTQHPLGALGALEIPGATAFNWLGFIVPGLLATWVFARLRERLPPGAGRAAGIGAWMLAISALGFAAQGLLPLDLADLDGPTSQLHASAWLLWWLAFASGAVLLAAGLRRVPAWRNAALALFAAAVLAVVLNVLPSAVLAGPVGQRVLLLLWLACVVIASRQR